MFFSSGNFKGVSIRKSLPSQIAEVSIVKSASNVTEDINRKFKRRIFKSKKRFIRYGLLTANILLVIGITSFIISSRNSSNQTDAPVLNLIEENEVVDPLDELSGADIAVNVALLVRMDQTTAVINNADTVDSQLDVVANDSRAIAKPQIVETSLKSKNDIIKYTTVKGDTVEKLAKKFKVSADSIKWSNEITTSQIDPGKKLLIPPVNGIVYRVKSGDTPKKLAERYKAETIRIVAFNDAEINGLKVDDQIVIPDGKQPAPSRSNIGFVGGFAFGSSAVYGYNGYDYGWCTWWAAKRRADVGKPIPANFGNACNWIRAAQVAGIPTSFKPKGRGDVIFTNSGCLGHVAFVEELNDDGSIWVTDMNSRGQVSKTDSTPAGGWSRVSWRLVTPDQFGRFQFIH